MSENNSGQEKTEEPTAKKIADSRSEGNVARSRELNTFLILIVAGISILSLGPVISKKFLDYWSKSFVISRNELMHNNKFFGVIYESIVDAFIIILPFLMIMVVISLFSSILMSGWVFSLKALSFKAEKLDPIKGIKRIFGVQGLIELIKALAKFILLSVAAMLIILFFYDEIKNLGFENIVNSIVHSSVLLAWTLMLLAAALLFVALIDVPFQLWNHKRNLKMSKQEVKEELKQTEGDPQLRSRIKAIQREMSKRRMMEDVKDADVILINPTHYSVAIKYNGKNKSAPIVVAKGIDFVALKIREIAANNDIHIYSEPMLTRAIFNSTEIGSEIPTVLYVAVAQVLAYVYQVDMAKRHGRNLPSKPVNLPVPEDLADK